mmetsp:Transcript_1322/g.3949  ORF Transcript_1322/g.3949 Transcript_1322/m.3949 type:complete len:200 (+) Transcript_1322:752-1351(+)
MLHSSLNPGVVLPIWRGQTTQPRIDLTDAAMTSTSVQICGCDDRAVAVHNAHAAGGCDRGRGEAGSRSQGGVCTHQVQRPPDGGGGEIWPGSPSAAPPEAPCAAAPGRRCMRPAQSGPAADTTPRTLPWPSDAVRLTCCKQTSRVVASSRLVLHPATLSATSRSIPTCLFRITFRGQFFGMHTSVDIETVLFHVVLVVI